MASERNGRPFTGVTDLIAVNQFREVVTNALQSLRQTSQPADPRRSVADECGYPVGLVDAQTYQELYERDSVSARVCEVMAKESWQEPPQIYEDESADVATPFEQGWDAVGKQLRGEHSYYQEEYGSCIWPYLIEADILCGIGHHSAVLLGLDDGLPLDQPARGIKESNSLPAGRDYTPSVNGGVYGLTVNQDEIKGRRLLYLRVFPETLAPATRLETNPTSPRYGQPVMYSVSLADPRDHYTTGLLGASLATVPVHWSRIVHVREFSGVPRMRPVLNNLLNLQKVYGADAEAFWKNCLMKLFLETHPGLGGDVEVDRDALRDMMEEFGNGLQNWAALMGMSAKHIAPSMADPTPHVSAQIEAICIKLGIPKRIFMGSERGELASSEDSAEWADRRRAHQRNHITPQVILPFIDRLIWLGVLPKPANGYQVWWPDIDTMGPNEKANVLKAKTEAYTAYAGGSMSTVIPPLDYMTRFDDLTEEEAKSILENAADHIEEQEEEDMQLQEERIERGLAPDPTGGAGEEEESNVE